MSKAPGSVVQYEGEGDWFKIKDELVCGSTADGLQDEDWCTWGSDRLTFNIPEGTPPGEYLVRAEHVGLHRAHVDETEFYYSCAQVKVTGNGSGSPSPLVQFPGAYSPTDPGIAFSIWEGKREYPYTIGPDVWAGGSSSSDGGNTSSPELPAEDEEDDDVSVPVPSPGQFFPSSSSVLGLSSTSVELLPTTLSTTTTTTTAYAAPSTTPDVEDDVEEDDDDPEVLPTSSVLPTFSDEDSVAPTPTPTPSGGRPSYPGPRRPKILECIENQE